MIAAGGKVEGNKFVMPTTEMGIRNNEVIKRRTRMNTIHR
jgi:hypothetical protein